MRSEEISLVDATSLDELTKNFATLVQQVFGAKRVFFFKLNPLNRQLTLNYDSLNQGLEINQVDLSDDKNPLVYSLVSVQPYPVGPVKVLSDDNSYKQMFMDYAFKQFSLCLPVVIKSQSIGVYCLFTDFALHKGHAFFEAYNSINHVFLGMLSKLLTLDELKKENQLLLKKNEELQKNDYESLIHKTFRQKWIDEPESQAKRIQSILHTARSRFSCLLIGPKGVGKKLYAELVYEAAKYRFSSLVKVNCAELNRSLDQEIAFFGQRQTCSLDIHERQIGALHLAKNGLLLIENVDLMAINVQKKFVRYLKKIKVSPAKMLFTAHSDLSKDENEVVPEFRNLVRQSIIEFNSLNTNGLQFEFLIHYWLVQYQQTTKKMIKGTLSNQVWKKIRTFAYNENVKTLQELVYRACDLTDFGDEVSLMNLEQAAVEVIFSRSESLFLPVRTLSSELERHEKILLTSALSQNNGNVSKTASDLGLSRRALTYKCRKYKIGKKYEVAS